MELLTKWIHNKKMMFWLAVSLAGVLILLVLLLLLMPRPSQTEAPVETTQETTAAPTTQSWAPKINAFSADDFELVDGYMTCTTVPAMLGVDVCSYQGQIDWQQVAAAGVEYAIIRVGGRGWGPEGKLYTDEYAQINYDGAKAAGLQVGTYFFSQATTVEEAQEEAQYVLQIMDGWELEMPVVFDWEQIPTWTDPESRTAEMDARTVTDCTVAFCEEIRAAGYMPMFYTNTHQYETFLYATEVDSYGVWAAQYSDRLTFPYYLNMWQYTDSGTVPGIAGEVDLNLYFPENILS